MMDRMGECCPLDPAVGPWIVDLEGALARKSTDHINLPSTSAAATSVRSDGIGRPTVHRPGILRSRDGRRQREREAKAGKGNEETRHASSAPGFQG